MEPHKESPNIRSGRFLWMEEALRKEYLRDLRRRIEQGYFFKEGIVSKIVDDIAPVMNECIDGEISLKY
jgi:predicted DNA-binding protein (UPF0278 family)